MQPYQTEFKLSKDYLAECFDETLPFSKHAKPSYVFPAAAAIAGVVLFTSVEQGKWGGVVLLAIAALELIHMKFRRTWWLARQMLGKTANNQVQLIVDDDHIKTSSSGAETVLAWSSVDRVTETERGLILFDNQNRQQYLSKAILSAEVVEFALALNQRDDSAV